MATKGGIPIDPSTLQNGPFSAKTSQKSKVEDHLGILFAACAIILFVIFAMYVFAKRTEEMEEEEAATKEENRRIFLKTHMNIKVSSCSTFVQIFHSRTTVLISISIICFYCCFYKQMYTDSLSESIDDEEAQKQVYSVRNGQAIFKTIEIEKDEDDSCSKASIGDSKKEENTLDVYYFEEVHDEGEKDICPICHEQFQDSEEVANSKNESCCQSVFHTECIISWLMTDHGDCPLCRSIFVPESQEVDLNNNEKST